MFNKPAANVTDVTHDRGHNMIKRLTALLATMALATLGLASINSPVQAAPGSNANQLTCFSDGSGVCIRNSSTSFTLINTTLGEGSGVYVKNQSLAGKPLSAASVLSFRYSGTVGGGSPRFAIPVDNPAVGGSSWDFFLAAQAYYCDANGDGVLSLAEPDCIVEADGFMGLFSDYLLAHPDYLIGSYYTFIVTDTPGTVELSEIQLARVGKVKS